MFRSVGVDVRRRTRAVDVEGVLRDRRIELVLDVGANTGQSGRSFRRMGYSGKIVSFEPVADLFRQLRARAARDPSWEVEHYALGEAEGQRVIHISGGHAGASSILEMTDNVRFNAADQRVVRDEEVTVTTLANVMKRHYPDGERCFLKVDVQGYEKSVLLGGLDVLGRVSAMKIEMSLVQNYHGEALLGEMLHFIYGLGFRAAAFEAGWSNARTGELYQVDCLFLRLPWDPPGNCDV